MFFSSLVKAIDRLIRYIHDLIVTLKNLVISNEDLEETNHSLTKEVRKLSKLIALRMPGLVWLKVVREESDMLVFVLDLPVKSAVDVVTRELSVKIGDAEPVTVNPGAEDTQSQEFSGADNTSVTGSLVDVDDAGNRSEARTFEFVLVDTIAPAQPGDVGLTVVREE